MDLASRDCYHQSYTVTGLRSGTLYTFRVKSNCGTSNYSIYSVEREMDVDCHEYSDTPDRSQLVTLQTRTTNETYGRSVSG
jgi:hypothetical protein